MYAAPHAVYLRYMQLTCKNRYFTCFFVENISQNTRNKARKRRVTSSAGCRQFYLPFANEVTFGVIADCLQLRVFFAFT